MITVLLLSNSVCLGYIVAKDLKIHDSQAAEEALRKPASRARAKVKAPRPETPPSKASLLRSTGLQACYESFLSREPVANEGSVVVRWTVDDKGRVAWANLERSEIGDERFQDCIIDQIKVISFAPAPNSEEIHMGHKFNFRRRTQANLDFQ